MHIGLGIGVLTEICQRVPCVWLEADWLPRRPRVSGQARCAVLATAMSEMTY